MSDKLLITGAVLRPNGFELGEGKYYGCAKLLHLNTDSGQFNELIAVDKGNSNFPDEYPNLEFTVGDIDNDSVWLTTDTEVRLYSYPELELIKTYSYPCFHNVHSVSVHGDELYVSSTGLDMIVVLDKYDGSIIRQINAEGKPVWHRFSKDIDYRKIHSTRPHDCHPNYVFWLNNEPWVTRCTQEDAVMLSDPTTKINISGPDKEISVHDGIVKGDRVYFTTVDGFIVIADIETHKVVESINLQKLKGYGKLRGWCRGLYISGNTFYIGFSRLRKTRHVDKIKWATKILNKRKNVNDCSVIAIDMCDRRIVGDYIVPSSMLDAIYTILPEPEL
jgi:hypothetical protein